jgi:hypothetical protein
MLMWYLSNAAMHGKNRNRGDCAQFLIQAPHKFGDGDDHGGGDFGGSWGDGSPYGSGNGEATGHGGGLYNDGNPLSLF